MKRCNLLSRFAYAALLVFGCSLLAVSCKDDDSENGNGAGTELTSDAKDSEQAMTLLGILQTVADIDTLPDNWTSATFEPTVGYVLDAAKPYVRSIAVENASEAAAVYANLTDKDYNASLTSDSWSLEGVGSLTYKLENKSDVIATIDCQLKQVPHLTQLRLVKSDALGENASSSFKGEAHYNFGDVVFDTEEKSYWICVRPALQNVKGDSHWFSFDLQDSNYKTYEANPKKNLKRTVVPTKLGKDVEMMGYLMNLLSVIANPNACADYFQKGRALENGLGNLGAGACSVSDVQRIARNWQAKGIWNHLPVGPEYFKQGSITVFYYGYSSSLFGGGMSIYGRNYTGDAYSQSSKADLEWDSYKNMAFDAHCYAQKGYNSPNNEVGPDAALIVRYRSSKDFDKKADPLKPFDKKRYVDTYRFRDAANQPISRAFHPGDIIREKTTGALYFCTWPSDKVFFKSTKALFVSLDPNALQFSADKKTLTNALSEEDALKAMGVLVEFVFKTYSPTQELLLKSAGIDSKGLFAYRDSTNTISGTSRNYCTSFVYKDQNNATQMMRLVYDQTLCGPDRGDKAETPKMQFMKCYLNADKARMKWEDVTSKEKVERYAHDIWTNLKFTDNASAAPWRTTAESSSTTLVDYTWSVASKNFSRPTVRSIFNEPLLIMTGFYIDESQPMPANYELVEKNPYVLQNHNEEWSDKDVMALMNTLVGVYTLNTYMDGVKYVPDFAKGF